VAISARLVAVQFFLGLGEIPWEPNPDCVY